MSPIAVRTGLARSSPKERRIGGRADCTWERLYLGGVLSAPSGLYLELYYNEVPEPESETSPGTVRSGSWRGFDFIGKTNARERLGPERTVPGKTVPEFLTSGTVNLFQVQSARELAQVQSAQE